MVSVVRGGERGGVVYGRYAFYGQGHIVVTRSGVRQQPAFFLSTAHHSCWKSRPFGCHFVEHLRYMKRFKRSVDVPPLRRASVVSADYSIVVRHSAVTVSVYRVAFGSLNAGVPFIFGSMR